jgi:hypothetical protein
MATKRATRKSKATIRTIFIRRRDYPRAEGLATPLISAAILVKASCPPRKPSRETRRCRSRTACPA